MRRIAPKSRALLLIPIVVMAAALAQGRARAVDYQDIGATKVWVNTGSGVYHCPGTRWYGNTKQGQYMTEKEAQGKGFRPDHGKACGSGETTTVPPSTQPSRTKPQSEAQAVRAGEGNPDTKVWVNTSLGVYHCPGTRWYGNTKSGKYMTQKEAQADGDRPAYGKPCQ